MALRVAARSLASKLGLATDARPLYAASQMTRHYAAEPAVAAAETGNGKVTQVRRPSPASLSLHSSRGGGVLDRRWWGHGTWVDELVERSARGGPA